MISTSTIHYAQFVSNETDAQENISSCANRLGVSYKTMSYRTKALELFTSI